MFSEAISAGGSGTVNETGFFGYWWFQDNSGTLHTYMLFHDILGAGVAFVAGNTINLSYATTM